jgi:phosphoglycolate phosphatase
MESSLSHSPALIFDLDGTLADTAPDLLSATNAVLAARGLAPIDLDAQRYLVGFGANGLITWAMEQAGQPVSESEIPPLADIFLTHYRAHICAESRLFSGVLQTLGALKKAGARLGILTNKPYALAELLLPLLGLTPFFDAVYGAGRKPYTKPDPRIFHDVVSDLGGGRAVMIGDSITDLKTARAAGVPCILLSHGYTPVPVRELGADLVLDDFADLPEALKTLGLL